MGIALITGLLAGLSYVLLVTGHAQLAIVPAVLVVVSFLYPFFRSDSDTTRSTRRS